jgi:alkylmercury lyase
VADRQIERLENRLVAAVPRLAPDEQTVGLALTRMLAEGEPVSDRRLAEALRLDEDTLRATVGSWPGVFRDDTQRIIGFMGLSVVPFGNHRIEVDGRTLSGWCAWDTLFLPELLGRPARVASRCPTTGEEISLIVGAAGPTDVRPAGTVLSFLAPERQFDADVMRSFCHFVHFFASAQAAAEWTQQYPRAFTISIEDGFRLGRLTNRATFGSALAAADIAA